jgi:hypothetical protein
VKNHYDQALDHVAAVHSTREHLRELFRQPDRSPAAVARLSADLGDALKLAGVHAALAEAAQLERIADLLEDRL